jgi:chromosome segregation ATPase
MTHKIVNWRSIGGVLCAAALLAGCATQGQRAQERKTTRAVASLEKTRTELVKADHQVDEAVAALNRLTTAPAALPAAYKVYTAQVRETSRQAREAQQRADRMREDWREYITAWEMGVDDVSTPGLQASANERREAARENYDRLRDAARALESAYQPFLTQLRDIETTLAPDLTPAGVNAARPAIEAVQKSAQNLKQQIGAFISEIDHVEVATTGRMPATASASPTAPATASATPATPTTPPTPTP